MNSPIEDSFSSMKFSKGHASMSPVRTRKPNLIPSSTGLYEFTLVLDLDETLVHFEASERKFKLRPFCLDFLQKMGQLFEIVIFTAASQDYADFILNHLDKQGNLIKHRLYR